MRQTAIDLINSFDRQNSYEDKLTVLRASRLLSEAETILKSIMVVGPTAESIAKAVKILGLPTEKDRK